MKPGKVRPIAVCVFRDQERILVQVGYDPQKEQTFFRPLGGRIEFGETGAETIVREIEEELGLEVTGVKYLGTLENIFIYNGEKGHEIVMLYDGRFVDPEVYTQPTLIGTEDDSEPLKAVWMSLADFQKEQAPPLYPTGLLELLLKVSPDKDVGS